MSIRRIEGLVGFLVLFCFGCSTARTTIDQPKNQTNAVSEVSTQNNSTEEDTTIYDMSDELLGENDFDIRILPELTVSAPRGFVLEPLNSATDRYWDLTHMNLDIRFDWEKEHVLGTAELFLTPYFYEQSELILDAKGFDIHKITNTAGDNLTFEYDGNLLTISLSRLYSREDQLNLKIDYTAKPSEGPIGGSAAITSDKGLFFINPRGEEGNKPRQIWTQGQTENNSRWFPTIDKPNENLTHRISMTVEDKYVTLSNGTKTKSERNNDNTRTDTWEMRQPHAPYLVMIAVGDFAVVQEEVDGLLYEYYVEPAYEPYAKEIFAHTPEMVQFFADLIDYPYPWDKYSQIITRDYVSGAMENTTAVIFGEFIQKTDRELIDNGNDYIVAHELFHHWFGDLVTCEGWSNLTLNEGFANYSEFLWQEYKYGDDAAGYQRKNEIQGYLSSIMQTGTHPLIHYAYEDKEDMFDGHSYNKGGLVLHMLRQLLGDAAFFEGLNRYLRDNVHTAVEVDELRMAFEDVSGLDLIWFFEQWYHSAGHPILEVSSEYDTLSKQVLLTVNQTQDPETAPPIFVLRTTVSVYNNEGVETRFDITVDEREYEVALEYPEIPSAVIFDTDDALLMVKRQSKSIEEYSNQYRWEDSFTHRYEAINKLRTKSAAADVLVEALDDPHFSIRKLALDNLRLSKRPELAQRLVQIAKSDPHSGVRGSAIKKLKGAEGVAMTELLQEVLQNEQSYTVIGDAITTLQKIDPDAALVEAIKMKDEPTSQLATSISRVLASSGDPAHLNYFEDRLTTISLFSVFNFYDAYYSLLTEMDSETIEEKAGRLKSIATDRSQNVFYKFTATNLLFKLKNDQVMIDAALSQKLATMVKEIKEQETNEMLKMRYAAF